MLSRRNPQLNAHGELIHLLSIEGLPKAVLTHILDTAGGVDVTESSRVRGIDDMQDQAGF